MKQYLINKIKQYQYYKEGVLESKTTEELQKIWNSLIDWIIEMEQVNEHFGFTAIERELYTVEELIK